jgi:hypothetical protein
LALSIAFGHSPFFEGWGKKDLGLAAIVEEDSGNVTSIDVDGDDHDIGMW